MEFLELYVQILELSNYCRFVHIVALLCPFHQILIGSPVRWTNRRHQSIITILKSFNKSKSIRSYLVKQLLSNLSQSLKRHWSYRFSFKKASWIFWYFLDRIEKKETLHCFSSFFISYLFGIAVKIINHTKVTMSNTTLHQLQSCKLIPSFFCLHTATNSL